MNRISPFVRGLAIIAVVALLILVLNLQGSLITAAILVNFAFYIGIGVVAYLLWRDFGRREIALWPQRIAGVFYGAVALAVVDLGWILWYRGLGGRYLLAFLVVAVVSIGVAVKIWREQHSYG